jgi:Sua5/YciO/YrdC/YwlC family protein
MRILEQDQFDEIIKALNGGLVVAVPTETVFGLAVKYDNNEAIEKLVSLKERDRDSTKFFTLMLSGIDEISKYGVSSGNADKIAKENFPGELTVVLRKNLDFANSYFDGFETIGIRIPKHDFMLKLLQKAGPLIVTSANKKGLEEALDSKAVEKDLPEVDVVVNGISGDHLPSTVVDLTTNNPKILRQGRVVL